VKSHDELVVSVDDHGHRAFRLVEILQSVPGGRLGFGGVVAVEFDIVSLHFQPESGGCADHSLMLDAVFPDRKTCSPEMIDHFFELPGDFDAFLGQLINVFQNIERFLADHVDIHVFPSFPLPPHAMIKPQAVVWAFMMACRRAKIKTFITMN
jgi:hypothetical protein